MFYIEMEFINSDIHYHNYVFLLSAEYYPGISSLSSFMMELETIKESAMMVGLVRTLRNEEEERNGSARVDF